MKRAPIVLTGTAVGLVAVVGYHSATPQATLATGSATLSSGSVSGGSATLSSGSVSGGSTSSSSKTSRAKNSNSSSRTTTALGPVAPSSTSSSGSRTAVGADYQYPYGDLAVEVTVSGTKITNVSVVKHDTTDPRSAMIDQYAIPILRTQALQVQSARINGISGASYTSAAYAQSLQSALDKLKV